MNYKYSHVRLFWCSIRKDVPCHTVLQLVFTWKSLFIYDKFEIILCRRYECWIDASVEAVPGGEQGSRLEASLARRHRHDHRQHLAQCVAAQLTVCKQLLYAAGVTRKGIVHSHFSLAKGQVYHMLFFPLLPGNFVFPFVRQVMNPQVILYFASETTPDATNSKLLLIVSKRFWHFMAWIVFVYIQVCYRGLLFWQGKSKVILMSSWWQSGPNYFHRLCCWMWVHFYDLM